MTYRVHIISTGETIETNRRGRNYQLWHEFLLSGWDDFTAWEECGYPTDTTLIDRYERLIQARREYFDALEFFDELDRMTAEILREPIDWAAVRADYERETTTTQEATECYEPQPKNSRARKVGQANQTADKGQEVRTARQ
jgi:hypothetical protein